MPERITQLGFERRAVLAFGALVLLVAAACRRATAPAACEPCVGQFHENPALQAQIEAQWQQVAPRLPRSPALDLQCLCFGAGASTSVEGQSIYLPSDWELPEQTARAVHLAAHRRQPPWLEHDDRACAARVQHALEREAEAHALELETRRALGVTRTRYSFEPDYFEVPLAQRHQWLRDYFDAHPTGDGTVPGFAASYRARCQ